MKAQTPTGETVSVPYTYRNDGYTRDGICTGCSPTPYLKSEGKWAGAAIFNRIVTDRHDPRKDLWECQNCGHTLPVRGSR